MKRKKIQSLNSTIFIILVLIITITVSVCAFISIKNINQSIHPINITNAIPFEAPTETPTPTIDITITKGWNTYINTKFGFSIKYPNYLNLLSTEYTRGSNPQLFNYGDIEPPNWIILLKDPKNDSIQIGIWPQPMSEFFGSGTDHDNYTFWVISKIQSSDNTNQDILTINGAIEKSIQFIHPDRPLVCSWLSNGWTQQDYLKQPDKTKIATISGYYYDSLNQICKYYQGHTWKGQEKGDSPPFKDINSCDATCIIK